MDEPSFTPQEIRDAMQLLAAKGWLVDAESEIKPAGGFTRLKVTEKGRLLAQGLRDAAQDLNTNPRLLYLASKLLGTPNEEPPPRSRGQRS
jgi:hypothetical protein